MKKGKDENRNILTREVAEERSAMVNGVNYKIDIWLEEGKDTYIGKTIIHFEIHQKTVEFLKLDFVSNKILSFSLNNNEFDKYEKNDFAIYIPVELLKDGNNTITCKYENLFDNTGSGFHKFIDPTDNNEYVHSDFEPYDAHRLFPSFDQPDIKATYKLKVKGPSKWQYIHNTLPIKSEKSGDYVEIEFKETKKFSTYLFALIFGPYEVWEDNYNGIPLKLYCRTSLKKYLDPENIFAITKESFKLLEEYFDYPYPFEKYDQIFVPEFNFGAMENVGAVTFSERYIFRNKMLYNDYLGRANTIVHEMVHMWFGNLVTMKWWNDLWLNESFADYLSYYTLSRGELFSDAMEHFFARKEWAYHQDQLESTHPIAAHAKDTDEAFGNFDGISYSKGASVLRQLQYFIGEDIFQQAMQKYFKKYQWANTELKDFLNLMSELSGIDIEKWSSQWLETTGVNTLVSEIEGKTLKVKQIESKDNNILREHAVECQSFSFKGERALLNEKIKLNISGRENQFQMESGENHLVVLNTSDYDFIKIYFQEKDIDSIEEHLTKIEDSFTRRIAYGSLWQMVRDGELSPLRFIQMMKRIIPEERDLSILQSHIVSKIISTLRNYLNSENEKIYNRDMNHFAVKRMERKGVREEEQIIWFNLLVATSSEEEELERLSNLLKGNLTYENLTIDQAKRWDIIVNLVAKDFSSGNALLVEEKKLDKSDLGMKKAFKAEVSTSDPILKEKYWKIFIENPSKLSTDYMRYGMQGFQWSHQKEILKDYTDQYFEELENIYNNHDIHYAGAFCSFIAPHWDKSEEVYSKLKKFIDSLDQSGKYPPLLKKDLLDYKDALERVIPIIKKQ